MRGFAIVICHRTDDCTVEDKLEVVGVYTKKQEALEKYNRLVEDYLIEERRLFRYKCKELGIPVEYPEHKMGEEMIIGTEYGYMDIRLVKTEITF